MTAEEIFSNEAIQKATLYLHIPFCTSICLYCGYKRLGNPHKETVERYLRTLVREAQLVTEKAKIV